jgi:hypothetical protein
MPSLCPSPPPLPSGPHSPRAGLRALLSLSPERDMDSPWTPHEETPRKLLTPSRQPRTAHPAATALVGIILGTLLLACGNRAKGRDRQDAPQPIEECDQFVAAYARCLGTLGPQDIATARAEQTRAGLAAQIQAAPGPTERTALRKQCANSLSQLKVACHQSVPEKR